MIDAAHPTPSSTARLILLPAVITLGVTLLRLAGELAHGSKSWFNADQGGYLGIVGIVWLVPIFGVYFALRLTAAGEPPRQVGRSIGLAAAACVVFALGFYLFNAGIVRSFTGIIVMWTLAVAGAALAFPAWRALSRVLVAYAYAARIPVAIVMALATWADWQTHYSTVDPNTPRLESYVLFGFIPQLVWWVSFTIVVGMLFGVVAAAFAPERQRVQQAA
ncbi:MAG TPA: hypothetical protein VG204_17180 [Terriglobia bacterium]|nr:hypothetical protein [Terriglobia bacterium]